MDLKNVIYACDGRKHFYTYFFLCSMLCLLFAAGLPLISTEQMQGLLLKHQSNETTWSIALKLGPSCELIQKHTKYSQIHPIIYHIKVKSVETQLYSCIKSM